MEIELFIPLFVQKNREQVFESITDTRKMFKDIL